MDYHYYEPRKEKCLKYKDSEPCSAYDNVPIESVHDRFVKFMANGQLSQNAMRKLYFGDSYDVSDNMEYIDMFNELQANRIAEYQKANVQATQEHNEELEQEREAQKQEREKQKQQGQSNE